MNDLLKLEHFSWWSLIILLAAFLLTAFAEFKREPGKYRGLRLMALLGLFVALAALYWKPLITQVAQQKAIVLLGEGTPADVADSLGEVYRRHIFIHHDTLFRGLGGQEVLLTGQGLPVHDIWKIQQAKLELHLESATEGITEFYPPDAVIRGDTSTWGGYYHADDSVRLKLTWNEQVVDSVLLASSAWFRLKHIPPMAGPQLYHIVAESGDTEMRFKVPADVKEPGLFRAGIFLTYPTFEARSLKEYLAASGFQVLVRQTISRNRYAYEYLNTPRQEMLFSNAFLKQLDLLILDQQFLDELAPNSLRMLEDEVHGGLGLVILSGGIEAGRGSLQLPVRLAPDKIPELVPDPGIRAVYRQSGYVRAGGKRKGQGMVMTSLLPETYTWLLEGRNREYKGYWSALIREAVRKQRTTDIEAEWPMWQDVAANIHIGSSAEPRVHWDKLALPPAQDLYLPFRWHVTAWASDTGWHELRVNGDTAHVYVHGPGEWSALRYEKQKRVLRQKASAGKISEISQSTFQPVSPWVFYALLLISFGVLWVEPKLAG